MMDQDPHITRPTDAIDRLTERYFAGVTSLEEERTLRRLLARNESIEHRPQRATMAYTAMMRRRGTRPHTALRRAMSIAAATATAVGLTFAALTFGAADSECYAMIDNRMIDDRAAVTAMVEATLGEVAAARDDMQASVASQLNEINLQL
ncbi:hypothetical protein [Paramuribaculum intestinale]|mgnify:CR=1 FL=1|uniref:hypothetical protein n=3 Tax=Paramuribaculum intestinale TaxID=2094151 RepID=UPI000FFF37FB|nr:hypothetical protein [Paramuribaculum intestinale]RXE63184.1 hypothetical protein ED375_01520 [Muribaculaceae bacterium Isolate-004 (NCI)]